MIHTLFVQCGSKGFLIKKTLLGESSIYYLNFFVVVLNFILVNKSCMHVHMYVEHICDVCEMLTVEMDCESVAHPREIAVYQKMTCSFIV